MQNSESFEARLDLVPRSPGVYLMKDASGSVIYVGKAVNLRRRLSNYFGQNPKGNEKVLAMISHIRDFSFLLCQNELEALVLESNLIKRYKPFYNILLKDDRDYPYIRVTLNEMYPRIMKAYRVGKDEEEGAKYYGPYLNGDIWQALNTIHKLFPLKTCSRVFPRDIGKERPCLNYYMKRCIAPCIAGEVSAEEYRNLVLEVCNFLEGRYQGIQKTIQEAMQEAAEHLDFERAAVLRDRLQALNNLQEKQLAVMDQHFDGDVLGLARNASEICVLKLEVRQGKIIGTSTYFLDASASSDEEVTKAFIQQYYPMAAQIPPVIFTQVEALAKAGSEANSSRKEADSSLEKVAADEGVTEDDILDREELLLFLQTLAGRKVQIISPKRGEKRRVLEMAEENAKQALRRRTIIAGSNQEAIDSALQLLGEIVGLEYPPARIEAYDVSNTGKDDMTCGMAVFENGKVRRGQMRSFTIRRQEGQDDYSAMEEAIDRRLQRLGDENFGKRPDLILLDGGLGHLTRIQKLLLRMGHGEIPLAAMVKDNRHRTRGLVLVTGETVELAESLGIIKAKESINQSWQTEEEAEKQVSVQKEIAWFSDDPGVEREQKLALLRLLSAVQNEVHRVAGNANKKLNKKRQTKYRLEEISGVGPKKRQMLMQAFKSIKEISEASVEDLLAKVPSLGQSTAEAVHAFFHAEEKEDV